MVDSTDVESFARHAPAFKALADPTRLRILVHLQAGEACVCRVQEAIGIPANLLSHHLKVLREAGLVTGTRRGRWIDYRIVPERLAFLAAVLTAVTVPAASHCRTSVGSRTVAA